MRPQTAQSTVLLIAGMRGSRCRETIAAALEAVPGVLGVDVNLYRARATITHDPSCDVAALFRATLNAGYNASLPEEHRRAGTPGPRGVRERREGAVVHGSTA